MIYPHAFIPACNEQEQRSLIAVLNILANATGNLTQCGVRAADMGG